GRLRALRSRRRGDAPPVERRLPSAMSRAVHRRDRGWRLRWAMLLTGDLVAVPLAYLLAFLLRVVVPLPFTRGYLPALRFGEVHHHWTEMLVAQLGALYFLGLYENRALSQPRHHVGALMAAAALQALVMVAVYFFRGDIVFPRSIFVLLAAINGTFLVAWRYACRRLMGRYPRRRVLIVGTNAAAAEVIDTVRGQHWLGMDIVGAASTDGGSARSVRDVPIVGRRDELPVLCERHSVDEVIIAS